MCSGRSADLCVAANGLRRLPQELVGMQGGSSDVEPPLVGINSKLCASFLGVVSDAVLEYDFYVFDIRNASRPHLGSSLGLEFQRKN